MALLMSLVLVVIWSAGTCVRVYRLARFYQIEEYTSGRFLRWLFSQPSRWLLRRTLVAAIISAIFALFTDSVPGEVSILPYIVGIAGSIVAVWPQSEGEVKKRFVRTQRATRMLVAAFGFVLLLALLIWISSSAIDSDRFSVLMLMATGLLLYLLAPVWLILGNFLMSPVEAALRQRFIRRAKDVMAAIQPRVIGITGSYGKTTTKNYLRDILNGRYKSYATPKSYNTMMGLCIAINQDLGDDYSTEYFIAEMGMYVPGEIARMCQLTPPDISIVIEVGPQHLERAGSIENIAKAKYEIIEGLSPDGLGVFNWDNPYVRAMYERGYPDNRIAVSKQISPADVPEGGPRFVASDIQQNLNGLSFRVTDTFTGETQEFVTPVVGEHNVMNLLLATAVAIHEGMTLSEIARRVRILQPAESRLVRQVSEAGITIINDAYSANPVGAVNALQVLAMHQIGRRVLVTPGMVELGELQDQENHRLGTEASRYATDIILVGVEQTRPIAAGVRAAGFPEENLHVVSTLKEAVDWTNMQLRPGDTVLFLNDLPDTY